VVLGSGEAGKSIAWHLGGTGKRVVVVEQRYVGGSCPNIACLPSKNIIHGASIAHTVAASEALGTRVASGVSMREIQARKRTMVEGLVQLHLNRFTATYYGARGAYVAQEIGVASINNWILIVETSLLTTLNVVLLCTRVLFC
jgi:pyruvate/2-oxoglutarate dehydrogenase complex dihydrolipoamide dehydrogenase (E3) component